MRLDYGCFRVGHRWIAVANAVVSREFVGVCAPSARPGRARTLAVFTTVCFVVSIGGCASPFVAQDSVVASTPPALSMVLKAPPAMPASGAGSVPAPMVARSLLEAPIEPNCEFRGHVSDPITSEEIRMKLDYEQQCYRQSEIIRRTRLQQLRKALGGRPAQDQPEPDCGYTGSLNNPASAEDMRMKLEHELQCYRHAESILRAQLAQLQHR